MNDAADEAIKQKAEFIETLKRSNDERTALSRARMDKITALTFAVNDDAFRGAWERITEQKIF